jgi:short-subunit dehydrogenase
VELRGRTALVTGATGGLGQAIARALAARGASPILTGRRAEVLEPLAAETGGRAVACDLGDPAGVDALLAEARDVDVLIANAGLPASGDLRSFSVEEIDRALAVNLRAPMVLARRLAEPMAARGEGHMVFMSSLSGKVASVGVSVYAATKFGLRGFAHALREDLRADGVGVSVILPGFISDAGLFQDAGVKLPPGVGTKRPQDVADAVVTAIERNRGEVVVAPASMRAGALLGGLAPRVSAAVQRRLGAADLAEAFERGQRDKRM